MPNKPLKDFSDLKNIYKNNEDNTMENSDKENFVNEDVKEVNKNNYYIKQADDIKEPAHAPYNFIPLNDKVISFKKPKENDKYYIEDGYNTGYIDLKIETKTPLFIKDTYTESEKDAYDRINEKSNKSRMDYEELWKHSDFFSPGNGKPRIPGSSLRGLIRTMVEIVSFGKFNFYDNKFLFFRGLADKSNLRNDYQNFMVKVRDKYFPNIRAGWIEKTGHNNYVLYPSVIDKSGNQFYRINFNRTSKDIDNSGTPPMNLDEYKFAEIYFNPVKVEDHTHYRLNKKTGKKDIPYKLKYALLDGISNTIDAKHPQQGYIVNTGYFSSNKHMHWVINIPDRNKSIPIDENIIRSYKLDENRNSIDILKDIESTKGRPCFFLTENDSDGKPQIASFGHTPMYRLIYEYDIKKHIPTDIDNIFDLSDCIFGNETDFAGRVFFEDYFCEKDLNDVSSGAAIPQILANPKPTCFQHYLTQNIAKIDSLKHYNSQSVIRGHKLYWHKKEDYDWKQSEKNINIKNIKQYNHKINPVKKETTFNGKIRFENLTDVELGALLFVLKIPENCCHKIGMAKPYGLGSIKITPELYLSNRIERYKTFKSEFNGMTKSNDLDKKIKSFEDFIKVKIGISEDSIWKNERFSELKKMLDYVEKPGNKKTEYMKIEPANEYKDRPVLPKPTDVK